MAQIKVKLVRSLIGSKKDQIATAQALGLRKIGDESVQPDNDQTKAVTNILCPFMVKFILTKHPADEQPAVHAAATK